MESKAGKLYLVATPIGNLEDITFRAVNTLREVDIIAAEDTRQTVKLLNHFGIKKPMTSYHEHNKARKGEHLIDILLEGKSVALVSDAGTPGISDPGEDIVKLAIENNIEVTVIPGPSAAIAGLVLSGLPTGRFVFEGLLPVNKKKRRERLMMLKDELRTIVMYEAPHKLIYTLNDLYKTVGNRKIVLARELTKKFEEITHCTLEEAVSNCSDNTPRGEYVIILDGAEEHCLAQKETDKWSQMSPVDHVQMYMNKGLSKKEAIKKAAEDRGVAKRDVYNCIMKKEPS